MRGFDCTKSKCNKILKAYTYDNSGSHLPKTSNTHSNHMRNLVIMEKGVVWHPVLELIRGETFPIPKFKAKPLWSPYFKIVLAYPFCINNNN